MSDGCTAVPDINERIRACCVKHDESYYYGGSAADRFHADREFRHCLLNHGMSRFLAWTYYLGVRAFGVPWLRRGGVSWAFGGRHFAYSDTPAAPTEASHA
jgi:hypothetical protein